jgi:hypothetical protein
MRTGSASFSIPPVRTVRDRTGGPLRPPTSRSDFEARTHRFHQDFHAARLVQASRKV